MAPRPRNLIILHSDEMRGDCPGFMGNRDCRTPNIDRFAKRGVVFTHHFTVHGKCVPSRIAMTTGRYCHTDAIRTVMEENLLPERDPDVMKTLRAAGYETAIFGHNHVWENLSGVNNKKGTGSVDYHSFTEGEFQDMLKREWPCPPPPPGGRVPPEQSDGYDYVGRRTGGLTHFCDDNRAEQAIRYLTKVRDRSRPFFLQLNISEPHPPYEVEEPYFSMYDPAKIRAWPHDLPKNAPLPLTAQRRIRTGNDAPDVALREVQACYFAMVTKVDALMGRVLAAIEAEGLFEDSVVIFTADHGDFAGQYGLCEKWDTTMSDCLLHVPFILRAPGLAPGATVDALTEHVDLPPTILELLDIAPDEKWVWHGESLLPVIRGERRKDAVYADGGHEAAMRARLNFPLWYTDKATGKRMRSTSGKQQTYHDEPDSMARTCMVRTDGWKLVVREVGGNELYDVQADPWEMTNRWGEPDLRDLTLELMQKLVEWNLRTWTDRPFQPQVGA